MGNPRVKGVNVGKRVLPRDAASIEALQDPEIEGYFRESHRFSTPAPYKLMLLAQAPSTLKAWARFWWAVFRRNPMEHTFMELLRVHIARNIFCEF
jgi:hypothetical protein